jgi:hypothetical protein
MTSGSSSAYARPFSLSGLSPPMRPSVLYMLSPWRVSRILRWLVRPLLQTCACGQAAWVLCMVCARCRWGPTWARASQPTAGAAGIWRAWLRGAQQRPQPRPCAPTMTARHTSPPDALLAHCPPRGDTTGATSQSPASGARASDTRTCSSQQCGPGHMLTDKSTLAGPLINPTHPSC